MCVCSKHACVSHLLLVQLALLLTGCSQDCSKTKERKRNSSGDVGSGTEKKEKKSEEDKEK